MKALRLHKVVWSCVVLAAACSSSKSAKPDSTTMSDAAADAAAQDSPCGAVVPTGCPNPKPSFKTDVFPVVEAKCNPCHISVGAWPLSSYDSIRDWQARILSDLTLCTMPPEDAGDSLSLTERNRILAWVTCGVPNN